MAYRSPRRDSTTANRTDARSGRAVAHSDAGTSLLRGDGPARGVIACGSEGEVANGMLGLFSTQTTQSNCESTCEPSMSAVHGVAGRRRAVRHNCAASEIATSSLRHVVVVDCDEEACSETCGRFEQYGYIASPLARGMDLQHMLEKYRVDLVVMDPALQGEDGVRLCRDLRAISSVPVIMVSSLADALDRVRGLEAGADDYLTKPLIPRELLARSKAVLRRCNQSNRCATAATYIFANWRLKTTSRQLIHKDGEVLGLKEAEFNVLVLLLSHAQRVLSRVQLGSKLAVADANPFDRTVDMHINRLRVALRDKARLPAIIKTIRGKGYVLRCPVNVE